ncbi:AlpA family transcriptional regulator [Thalassococcus sp. S3]|uniref:helix-turn-helix transcriptional regulator n=1 Tax=Thalassococcus sp. S3 TaxID=2017482 RepID=UPI0010240E0D|nr:DNA-binding protein [Thalassococcus sp. S3]
MASTTEELPILLLSVQQVATMLGCHKNTVWNRSGTDTFPKPIKWGGKTVWRRSDIEAFVDQLAA